jgi:NADP-dependent 3-hydroxy acid dehydrogenase YdfG
VSGIFSPSFRHPWNLILCDRPIQQTSLNVNTGVETFKLDVTKLESIGTLKDQIAKRQGRNLDVLFHNVGTNMSYSHLRLLARNVLEWWPRFIS